MGTNSGNETGKTPSWQTEMCGVLREQRLTGLSFFARVSVAVCGRGGVGLERKGVSSERDLRRTSVERALSYRVSCEKG